MTVKDVIDQIAKERKHFKTSDVVKALGDKTSRTYVSQVMTSLVNQGTLIREGSGRWSIYALPSNADSLGKRIKKRYINKNLEEYEVLDALKKEKPFLANLKKSVQSIFAYAFSEMLNNAIEHSESKNIEVEVRQEKNNLVFFVRDYGIGVFRNVMTKRYLNSELEAIQDLLKGKTTTAPQAHSGEGIFFTSRSSDIFMLESYGYRLRIDNQINDIFVEETKPEIKGTLVTFQINIKSKRHLSEVFADYQVDPDEPAFDKTEVKIKLYTMGTIYISRSQARRVLAGLNKFRRIILDFDKVPTVGQAFSDEIFRVFKSRHPEIEIIPINMNEAVKFMVNRVEKPAH